MTRVKRYAPKWDTRLSKCALYDFDIGKCKSGIASNGMMFIQIVLKIHQLPQLLWEQTHEDYTINLYFLINFGICAQMKSCRYVTAVLGLAVHTGSAHT
jgi:hypothetical protein